MFDPTSRYYAIQTNTLTSAEGREITFIRRRFLPQGESVPLLVEVAIGQSERLDLLTNRTLGDPVQYWRICDANNAMNPSDLTTEPNRILRVPMPGI